ncbi:MAG: hypothetical protein GY713_22365 [Actinomycetia bacterium]|nr:hypothetical protein [Actinomycetes bacterium]
MDQPFASEPTGSRRIADEMRLRETALRFADAIYVALPIWIDRTVTGQVGTDTGFSDEEIAVFIERAGKAAQADIGSTARQMLGDATTKPAQVLELLQTAVHYPTGVLHYLQASEAERGAFAQTAWPEDIYSLTPKSMGDIDESLEEPFIRWDAARKLAGARRRR